MTKIERLNELQNALADAYATVAKARNLLLESAAADEFGEGVRVSREEYVSIGQDNADVVLFDKMLSAITERERQIGNRIYQLKYPDDEPPF